jgi:hypothetical protein
VPATPDRHPGPLIETEEIILGGDEIADPTALGALRYVGGTFRLKDAVGVFDPRSGGGGITEAQHKILRQLIHFLDDGPGEGFASGAYKETTGTVFPTVMTWWESAAKLIKIVERAMTWSGAKLMIDEWRVYSGAGTLLATVTDTISYAGVFETSRTRVIS